MFKGWKAQHSKKINSSLNCSINLTLILIKIQQGFFVDKDKLILKFIWNGKAKE